MQNAVREREQIRRSSHVDVALDLEGEMVAVTVEDDGCGFDVEETLAAARERKSAGLIIIQERMEMLEGVVEIDSSMGRGTKVRLELPGVVR